jgi:hypothetical protein
MGKEQGDRRDEKGRFAREKGQEAKARGEREFEIGMDESWKANMKMLFDFILANMKRTAEEYQHAGLTAIHDSHSYVQKILSDAQLHFNTQQHLATQALQNAVVTSDMVAKQALRHSDIAIDRQWNVDEVAQLVAQVSTFKDAIAAAVAAAVNEALKATK